MLVREPVCRVFITSLTRIKSRVISSVSECLEELGILLQNNGMVVCGASPQKTVPLIAAQISDRDNTVRTAALNTFVIIHGNIGDDVYKFTSQVLYVCTVELLYKDTSELRAPPS